MDTISDSAGAATGRLSDEALLQEYGVYEDLKGMTADNIRLVLRNEVSCF